MLHPLSRSRLGVVLGLGSLLLIPVVVWSQRPASDEAKRPPATPPLDADVLRQAEQELQLKRAQLQQFEQRVEAELKARRAELRAAEERLQQAKAQLEQREPPAEAPVAGAELLRRLQQLEQKVERLQKELDALRKSPSAQRPGERKFTPVLALLDKVNHKSKEVFHSGRYPGNTLASLATGAQTLGGIDFLIGEGVVQLGSTSIQDKPEQVTGIAVGKKLAKLHILHATGYYLEDQDKRIGAYTIHYQDGTSATIPIVYGQDVLDWWKYPGAPEPTRSKVAWEGTNEAAREFEATLRLYLTSWENPQPGKVVTSIDYASTMDTPCAPFCVAMTVEEP